MADDPSIRTFRGAIVRYGDGAGVTNVSLSSEYSSVRLDGLPLTATPADVVSILEGLGHGDVLVDGLRLTTRPGSPTCSAYISTPDTELPSALAASLASEKQPDGRLSAHPMLPDLPPWASTRRVRRSKLKVTWSARGKECGLFFKSEAIALEVSRTFTRGVYDILGCRVQCTEPSRSLPIPSPEDTPWGIILLGLPDKATTMDVRGSIRSNRQNPDLIQMMPHQPWGRGHAPGLPKAVRALLEKFGPLDFVSRARDNGRVWTAYAQFAHDSHAREAERAIQAKDKRLLSRVDLRAKLLYTCSFRTTRDIYRFTKTRLRARLRGLAGPRMSVADRGKDILLSLECAIAEDMAARADAIEEILAGHVIRDSEEDTAEPFWVADLAANHKNSDSALSVLREMSKEHHVLVLPNRAKRTLTFFGDIGKLESISDDVAMRLGFYVVRTHTIAMDLAGVEWAYRTGLGRLHAVLGADGVFMDIVSQPSKLVIRATDMDYMATIVFLALNGIEELPKMQVQPQKREDCSICLSPTDHPLVLTCGHWYCADCFKGLCEHADATTADLHIVCKGAGDTCKKAALFNEMQAHLPRATFEQVLEGSFNAYISRRPNQFHYCPTPDCGYIYRPADMDVEVDDDDDDDWEDDYDGEEDYDNDGGGDYNHYDDKDDKDDKDDDAVLSGSLMHMCIKCLRQTCRRCHSSHESETCESSHAADQAFERYKRSNRTNVKDCPRCHTTVEKIDGCDHIHCTCCSAHLCWVCLASFDTSDPCYQHMREVHGGIGGDYNDDHDQAPDANENA